MKQSTSLKENFKNYLDESGIHGFSYLHPRKHYISRLFWVGLESMLFDNTMLISKGAVLTSATVPWHGLIFCLEGLP